ncbi:MAG TPA: trehalose-phosphatase [Candidatus Acidoferrales bacterium]
MATSAQEKRADPSSPGLASARRQRRAISDVRNLAGAWPEVIARIRDAEHRLLLLDFDGTLVRLRRHPDDVQFSARGRAILERLAGHKNLTIAVVSGRELEKIQNLVGVEGIRYVGLHGAERVGETTVPSIAARQMVEAALEAAQTGLAGLRGIEIEDKRLSFAVHYRGAHPPAIEAASRVVADIVASSNDKLRILCGKKVWELLPREFPGKGVAVLELFARLPEKKIAIYFGDDETDEEAFSVLPGQITVNVGGGGNTHAAFYVRSPSEVLQFLSRLEKQL